MGSDSPKTFRRLTTTERFRGRLTEVASSRSILGVWREGSRWLALATFGSALEGCGPALFYVGDPTAAPDRYLNRRDGFGGESRWALEQQFEAVDVAQTQAFDTPPEETWRPLADLSAEADDAATALSLLKQKASSFGADGVVKLGTGAGDETTTSANEAFVLPILGATVGGESTTTTTSTRYRAVGTAIHRGTPGKEVFLGLGCMNYAPNGALGITEGYEADKLVLTYVTDVGGPAAAAGLRAGDFILSWAGGRTNTLHPRIGCANLHHSLREDAAPGETIAVEVWRPGGSEVLDVRLLATRQAVRARDVHGFGVMVAGMWPVPNGTDELHPGDFVEGFADAAAFNDAVEKQGELRFRVRREGSARVVKVTLGSVPDSWYRRGPLLYSGGPGPTAPAVAPSPAPAGCGRDTDCKGDRVCTESRCVDPSK